MSHLDQLKHLTFENFAIFGHPEWTPVHAESVKGALELAENYATKLNGWMLFSGKYGCGKTHLAAAIANYAVSMGVPTLFLTVPDLLDTLRFAYDAEDTTFEQRFNEIRNANLLVMDDLGTQNDSEWAQEKLFQIINYRYINKLPTVLTTNLDLDEIEGRVRSRLQDNVLVQKVWINAPDYRRPQDAGQSRLSSLDTMLTMRFDNFSLRREHTFSKKDKEQIEKAYNAAHEFAEKPEGWLFLHGGYGVGKTHLAAAIGNYRKHVTGLADAPMFIVAPDLFDHLRATFGKSEERFSVVFSEIRTARLLIIDDLGAQSKTPWTQEKLHQLISYRYNAKLPTVITTADQLKDVDERIRAKIFDKRLCKIYAMTFPPYFQIKEK